MVDSEDITLEKIKTQELSLEINNLSNTFQQNTTVLDSPPEPPQVQVMDPNNKSKPQFKKYCSFCHKNNHSVSTFFRRLNMLKESNHNLDLRLPHFINILKILSINLIILATVVEVIVTLLANLLATLDINLVLIHVHIHVPVTIQKPTPEHIHLITIVIDLNMTNITIILHKNHILLHVHIIVLIPLVVHLKITLVLVNVPQILTPLLSTDTILLIVLFLNHVMIAIVVDLIQTHTTILKPNINHL